MYNTKASLAKGLDKEFYKQVLRNANIVLSASSMRNIFEPTLFLFSHVLKAEPIVTHYSHNPSMNEHRKWGDLYHQILEASITNDTVSLERDKSMEWNIEQVLGKSIDTFLSSKSLHFFMKKYFASMLQHFDVICHKELLESTLESKDMKGIVKSEEYKKEPIMAFDMLKNISRAYENYAIDSDDDAVFGGMQVKGRVDLLYHMSDDYHYIIDFKRSKKANNTENIAHLFQIWVYHLIWNGKHITQLSDATLYGMKGEKNMGQLYFVCDDPPLYPKFEKKDKDIITATSVFPALFMEAMKDISNFYDAERDTLLDTLDAQTEQAYHALKKDSVSLAEKCITRKGSYIYVK